MSRAGLRRLARLSQRQIRTVVCWCGVRTLTIDGHCKRCLRDAIDALDYAMARKAG